MSMSTARADNPWAWESGEQGAIVPPEISLYVDGGMVLERLMRHPALDGLDTSEAGVLWRILSPIANELATAYLQLQRVIQLRSLVGPVGRRAYGPYLDELGWMEMGVPRDNNVAARYTVTFRGPPGTLIPQGTVVSFPARELDYLVVVGTVLGSDGIGGAIVECRTPGLIGNVPANSITRVVSNLPEVGVTNEFATPLIAGTEIESDEAYRVRLLRYRRDPPNGTNAAQFRTWAEQVPGVGRAQVVRPAQNAEQARDPRRPRPGTVDIYVVGMPLIEPPRGPLASSATVDAVQQWIAPAPLPIRMVATDWTGLGTSPLGATAELPTARMGIAGIWSFRPQLALTNGPADPSQRVGEMAAVNLTDTADLPVSPSVPGDARRALLAGELSASPPLVPSGLPELHFYWDGAPNNEGNLAEPGKHQELHIEQNATDVGALEIRGGWLVGQFSDPDQQGLASVADRVQAFAAPPVPLDVAVTVQAQPGWSEPAVQQSVRSALEDYLRSICFGGGAPPIGGQPDPTANDVLYGVVTAVVINAPGVAYIRNRSLRVNGGTDDVEVWQGDVATLASLECTVELTLY